MLTSIVVALMLLGTVSWVLAVDDWPAEPVNWTDGRAVGAPS
jgi:hypothetical protein